FSTSPVPTHLYTLPLHDALPISAVAVPARGGSRTTIQVSLRSTPVRALASPSMAREPSRFRRPRMPPLARLPLQLVRFSTAALRSEEHTSELQSLAYLVCRLLLE